MVKKTFTFFMIISLSFLLYACACNCGANETADIPEKVLMKSDEFITAKTGKDFFEKYIRVDLNRSKEVTDGYHLVYRLIMPEKPYVNEVIEFYADETGNVKKEREVIGIPDCGAGCGFSVSENEAVKIAEDAGLPEGIIDWKTGFMWEPKYDKYVWRILSTTSQSEGSEGFRGDGEEILIDPNSGEIIVKQEWHVR